MKLKLFLNLKVFINKFLLKPKIKNFGNNNEISLSKNAYYRKAEFCIYGNNNKIIIKEGVYLHNCKIKIGFGDCKINNCKVVIGKNTSCNGMTIQLGESESEVIVGEDCMISFNVKICCSDTHCVLDNEGNLINRAESIKIGSKVWLGENCTILKNSYIPDNCVVGYGAVVAKKFSQPNCVIAGNPGKIVKENISWSRLRPEHYKNDCDCV